jgi:hypothetical protein
LVSAPHCCDDAGQVKQDSVRSGQPTDLRHDQPDSNGQRDPTASEITGDQDKGSKTEAEGKDGENGDG